MKRVLESGRVSKVKDKFFRPIVSATNKKIGYTTNLLNVIYFRHFASCALQAPLSTSHGHGFPFSTRYLSNHGILLVYTPSITALISKNVPKFHRVDPIISICHSVMSCSFIKSNTIGHAMRIRTGA